MERKITGYHLDEYNDWVADLDCYHGQHVRNKPPFINRPWVDTEEGRNSKLGEILNCVRCDRLEFPDNLVSYKRTQEFNERSIPEGLKNNHATKAGAWGIIHIVEGLLLYTVKHPDISQYELTKGQLGIIVPCMPHCIAAKGRVRFYMEFYTKKEV